LRIKYSNIDQDKKFNMRNSYKTPIKIGSTRYSDKYRPRLRVWESTKTPLTLNQKRLESKCSPQTNNLKQDFHDQMDFMDHEESLLQTNDDFEVENCETETHDFFPNSTKSIFKSPNYLPTFSGCQLSVNDCSLLIVSFVVRHNLTGEAEKDLVQLIRMIIPSENSLPKSFNKVFSKLSDIKTNINVIKYCKICREQLDNNQECVNDECDNYSNKQFGFDTFHYVDIKPQLTDIINSYWPSIKEYRENDLQYMDFINSSFYKKEENTFQICVYTDGVPIFKNPSKSAWPVFASIVELPPSLRESRKSKIIAGVYFGQNSPSSDNLFEKIIENIKTLEITIEYNGQSITNKFKLYGFEGDTPGKAKSLAMKGHKGYFSCTFCLTPGII
jgi:hypothetical protein